MRKDPKRGPKNWQKYILLQKNVMAGKTLPYEPRLGLKTKVWAKLNNMTCSSICTVLFFIKTMTYH